MNANPKVTYWLNQCDDDLVAVRWLLKGKQWLHAMFFCHLVAEKALKAVIEGVTDDVPPKIHNLRKLSEYAGLVDVLSEEQKKLLTILNPYHIETRYPTYKRQLAEKLTADKCSLLLSETEEFVCWIKKRLNK